MNNFRKIIALLLAVVMILPSAGFVAQAEETNSVTRIGGKDRIETAIDVSKHAYKDGSDVVVLTGHLGEVDALTGTLLAASEDAPILMTRKAQLTEETKVELKRLKAKKVYILGGENVVSEEVETTLKSLKYNVERIKGVNRFETAANVAKEVKKTNSSKHAFIVKGYEARSETLALADALAIGPVSAKQLDPVLLVESDKLRTETKAALKDLGITSVTIIGGSSAVSDKVETEIKAIKGITVNERVFGEGREKTALNIASKYFNNVDKAIVANAKKSADALIGGYLGKKVNAPILLTNTDKLAKETEAYITANVNEAYILGGTAVVSTAVEQLVEKAVLVPVKADIEVKEDIVLTRDYDSVEVVSDDVTVDLGGKTVKTLTVTSNDTIIKNGIVLNLNIEEDVVNITLEDIVDDGEGNHTFAGGGSSSIVLKENTLLNSKVEITSLTPLQIRSESLNEDKGLAGKVSVNTSAALTLAVPVSELEIVKENKEITIKSDVNKVTALADTEITLDEGVSTPKLEKAEGVAASAKDSEGIIEDFEENTELEPTEKPEPDPGGGETTNPPVDDTKKIVTTSGELKEAIEDTAVTDITVKGTLGSEETYNIYNVNRSVTIKGTPESKVFGTFMIKSKDVKIENLSIQNEGDLGGNQTNGPEPRANIVVYAENVTLINNVLTNGLGDQVGLANAIQIFSDVEKTLFQNM